jgi:hypothetical protein
MSSITIVLSIPSKPLIVQYPVYVGLDGFTSIRIDTNPSGLVVIKRVLLVTDITDSETINKSDKNYLI